MSVVEAVIILIALRFRWLVTFFKRRYDEWPGRSAPRTARRRIRARIHVRAGQDSRAGAFGKRLEKKREHGVHRTEFCDESAVLPLNERLTFGRC